MYTPDNLKSELGLFARPIILLLSLQYPDAPCMVYLPTLGSKWPHSRGNVGKYSLHGAFGVYRSIQVHG